MKNFPLKFAVMVLFFSAGHCEVLIIIIIIKIKYTVLYKRVPEGVLVKVLDGGNPQ